MGLREKLLPLLFLSLLCSVALAGRVVRSEAITYETLRSATGDDELRHEFSSQPETVRVHARCKLKRGELAWRVIDPEGNVVWEKRISGRAQVDLEEEIAGLKGEWRIALDYTGAKGNYYFKMEAVGLP